MALLESPRYLSPSGHLSGFFCAVTDQAPAHDDASYDSVQSTLCLSSHLKLLLLGSLTAAQALHLEEVGAAGVRHDASLAARLFILLSDDWTSGTGLCLRRETEEASAFVTVHGLFRIAFRECCHRVDAAQGRRRSELVRSCDVSRYRTIVPFLLTF